jgi:hypothetical protein
MIEQSRSGLIMAMSALAQSIPQLAAGGADPMPIIAQQAKFITLLQKGKTVEQAATEALTPPEPPPSASTPGAEAIPGSESALGGAPQSDIEFGLANEGPNGRPDLQQMFAGLTGTGAPNLQAGISRMNPVAGQ